MLVKGRLSRKCCVKGDLRQILFTSEYLQVMNSSSWHKSFKSKRIRILNMVWTRSAVYEVPNSVICSGKGPPAIVAVSRNYPSEGFLFLVLMQ
jgi:hypothetical protein